MLDWSDPPATAAVAERWRHVEAKGRKPKYLCHRGRTERGHDTAAEWITTQQSQDHTKHVFKIQLLIKYRAVELLVVRAAILNFSICILYA